MTPTLELVFIVNMVCFTALVLALIVVHREAAADMRKLRKSIADHNQQNTLSINRRLGSISAKTEGWYSMLEKQDAGQVRRLEKLEDRVAKILKAITTFKTYYGKALDRLDERIRVQSELLIEFKLRPAPELETITKDGVVEVREHYNTPLGELNEPELMWWITVALDQKDKIKLFDLNVEIMQRSGCRGRFTSLDPETMLKLQDAVDEVERYVNTDSAKTHKEKPEWNIEGGADVEPYKPIPHEGIQHTRNAAQKESLKALIEYNKERSDAGLSLERGAKPTHHTCDKCELNFPNEVTIHYDGLVMCGDCWNKVTNNVSTEEQ